MHEGDTWKAARRHGAEGDTFQHVSSGVSFGSPGGMKAFIRISFAVSHLASLGEHLDPVDFPFSLRIGISDQKGPKLSDSRAL